MRNIEWFVTLMRSFGSNTCEQNIMQGIVAMVTAGDLPIEKLKSNTGLSHRSVIFGIEQRKTFEEVVAIEAAKPKLIDENKNDYNNNGNVKMRNSDSDSNSDNDSNSSSGDSSNDDDFR